MYSIVQVKQFTEYKILIQAETRMTLLKCNISTM